MSISRRYNSARPRSRRTSYARRSNAVAEVLEQRLLLTAVVSGQGINGDIPTAIQENTYTFTATAGGTIEASVGESGSALAPVMNLFSPGGILLQSVTASSAGQIITLSQSAATSGTYSIVIEAGIGTGAYEFSEASVPGTQTKDTLDNAGGPVTSGQGVSGELDGQLDAYSFTATAGGTIEASAGEGGSTVAMAMDLFSPTGTLLDSDSAASAGQIITLSQAAATTGTYYIVLRSANGDSGAYEFSEASLPGTQTKDTLDSAGGPVASGQGVSGELDGQLDAYSLTATAGGTIEASAGEGGSTVAVALDLFSPTGVLLKSAAASTAGQIVTFSQAAATTGTYYIVINSANGLSGAYEFSEASAPGTLTKDTLDNAGGPVTSGEGVSGELDGQLDSYSFTATAGGTIDVSAGEGGSTVAVALDLFSPAGALLKSVAASTAGQIVTLSQAAATTGTYYVVVSSANGLSGAYEFSEASVPGTQTKDTLDSAGGPVTSGQETSGELDGQLDSYSFAAAAGGPIDASAGEAGSTVAVAMDLFSPAGVLLKSVAASTAGQTVTLSQDASTSGNYYIVITSANGDSGAYKFLVTTTAPAASIVVTPPAAQTAAQGVSKLFTLGSFTETGATAPYSVSVNWGDGSPDLVFAMAAPGTITPQIHTYAGPGPETVSVTITDADSNVSNVATFGVTVAPAPSIVVTPPASQTATDGVSQSFALGSFSETGATGPYSVSVNWGDGSADTIFSMATPGTITPQNHTYAATGPETVAVTITDADGNVSNPGRFAVSVAAPIVISIVATPPPAQTAAVGVAQLFALGSFTESGATGPYSVKVSWGDGSPDMVFAMATPGTITVQNHTYAGAGPKTVGVTVTDADGHVSNTATFGVTVAPVPTVTVTPPPSSQTATAGVVQSFALGTFSETGATGPFSVSVNWGDGTADTVFSMALPGSITAQSHTYAAAGPQTIGVTITDADGHVSNTGTFGVSVSPPAVIAIFATPPSPQTATVGVSQSFALGSFTESGATGPYSVSVDWGDGTPNTVFAIAAPGTITAQNHTYAGTGPETVGVTVTDADGHVSNDSTFAVTVAAGGSIVATPPIRSSQ